MLFCVRLGNNSLSTCTEHCKGRCCTRAVYRWEGNFPGFSPKHAGNNTPLNSSVGHIQSTYIRWHLQAFSAAFRNLSSGKSASLKIEFNLKI